MDRNEKQFDWVQARYDCSAQEVFKLLESEASHNRRLAAVPSILTKVATAISRAFDLVCVRMAASKQRCKRLFVPQSPIRKGLRRRRHGGRGFQ